ncbi:MAG: hypothetical protein GPOALKHO_001015 [Sodalis sp.]|nr:MAG: hypothetical protein GPOALKHO_001015 [Sodalis sp.]
MGISGICSPSTITIKLAFPVEKFFNDNTVPHIAKALSASISFTAYSASIGIIARQHGSGAHQIADGISIQALSVLPSCSRVVWDLTKIR